MDDENTVNVNDVIAAIEQWWGDVCLTVGPRIDPQTAALLERKRDDLKVAILAL